jgi:hypothetical protein
VFVLPLVFRLTLFLLVFNLSPPPPPGRYRHWVAYLNWPFVAHPSYSEMLSHELVIG